MLATPELAGGSQQFRDLSVEYSRLQPLAERFDAFRSLEGDLAAARELTTDTDVGMRSLGEEEVQRVQGRIAQEEVDLAALLIPKDERSQHKNRSRAMALLKARLLAAEQEKQQSAQAQSRKLQVGSGDRSERIRTYNFPQGRVTDHRINLTLYKLADVMDGKLDELIEALQQEYRAEQLAAEVGG